MDDAPTDDANILLETPASDIFIPPSVHREETIRGESYTHFSPVPPSLLPPPPSSGPTTRDASTDPDTTTTASTPDMMGAPCVLGVDEAGRGPVLGPMVYGVFYLPLPLSDPLLRQTHRFDDSKVLTPAVRSSLMRALCTPGSDLHASAGWAVSSLSARDVGAHMLRPAPAYNLNAQAVDATVALIRGVLARGVNVREIYVDTVGPPATYQLKLERLFPTAKITVAKKADSLYPCVSAASVCAKVTRDAALDVLYEARAEADRAQDDRTEEEASWGSGYPSDARCVNWLRRNMHPVFGWGPECRFSWGTAKDMLETKGGVKIDWPVDEDDGSSRLTDFFVARDGGGENDADGLGTWFGTPAGLEAF